MRKLIRKKKLYAFLIIIAAIFIFMGLVINYATSSIISANEKKSTVTVDVPTGSSFVKITEILSDAGIVRTRVFFYSLALAKRALRSIRAGEYEFSTSLTPSEVIDKLLRGEIKVYRVTIPEDLSVREIAARLLEYKLVDEKTFFKLAVDEEFLASLGIKAVSIEGYLFPDTYFFDRSMSTRQIMKTMVNEFWKKVDPQMLKHIQEMGFSLQEFVTLASIIGKESGNGEEKPSISAVFHNRLKRKMPLQSDPTAVYDLENFNGAVLRCHLKRQSPYNTYLIKGLPPGPIANPGIDSLKAALYPARVTYLYFVAKNDGSHFFSSTLERHNNAINRFRRNRSRGSEAASQKQHIGEKAWDSR
jgi:UPF0755 protein